MKTKRGIAAKLALVLGLVMIMTCFTASFTFAEPADSDKYAARMTISDSAAEYAAGAGESGNDSADQGSYHSGPDLTGTDGAEAAEELMSEDSLSPDSKAVSDSGIGSNESDPGDDVEEIVSRMSLRQKITQCFMMEFRYRKDDAGNVTDITELDKETADVIADYQFGGVILFSSNIKKTDDTLNLVKDMQTAAMRDKVGGRSLPMLIATDQEGGLVYRLGSGTALPGNMALAATGDTNNARITGEIIGRELGALGINTTLAPVLDINSNAGNPIIGIRAFSDDADTVARFGNSYIEGLNEYGIIGCAKHFPGHGDTDKDSHTGLPIVDKSLGSLFRTELVPFQAAVDQGVDMIMTAHILYPRVDSSTIISTKDGKKKNRPATLSHKILTEILREDMGFEGVIVTDSMEMDGITNSFNEGQAALEAPKAGSDIICMPVTHIGDNGKGVCDNKTFLKRLNNTILTIEAAALVDRKVRSRIDDAVTRVLTLKKEKGILDYDPADYTIEKAEAAVGSDENRALEREMTSKAVTVVRNDKGILPYRTDKNTKVLMLCPYNNEMAQMVMGLNRAKKAGVVPESVEVMAYRFSGDDCKAEGILKEKIDWADLVILNSEVTDSEDMSYEYFTSIGVKNITDYCRSAGKKSVVMSVYNPYDVQLYPAADAVLAVYCCKGSGVGITDDLINGKITSAEDACGPNIIAGVEAVFGAVAAEGRLPVNIPAFDSRTKKFTDKILYERGYGLKTEVLKPTIESGKLNLTKDKYEYTGNDIEAGVEVRDADGSILVQGTDYAVSYDNNKNVGTASVTVTGTGRYCGTLRASFEIVPKRAAVRTLKAGRRCIDVIMTAAPSGKAASGYRIAYRIKGSAKWKYKNTKKKRIRIRRLKRGKRYQVKVRAFKKVSGKKYYGSWSKIKTGGKIR